MPNIIIERRRAEQEARQSRQNIISVFRIAFFLLLILPPCSPVFVVLLLHHAWSSSSRPPPPPHFPHFSQSLQSSIYSAISVCGNLSIWKLSRSFSDRLFLELDILHIKPTSLRNPIICQHLTPPLSRKSLQVEKLFHQIRPAFLFTLKSQRYHIRSLRKYYTKY